MKENFPCDIQTIRRYAMSTNVTYDWLVSEAKRLSLVVTLSSRNAAKSNKPRDRVGFGLKTKVVKAIKGTDSEKITTCLFKWGLRKNSMLYPSEANEDNINLYVKYAEAYRSALRLPEILSKQKDLYKQDAKVWSEICVDALIESRSRRTPPSFRNIAGDLNRLTKRVGIHIVDREYTARDCINKWKSLFPSGQDANLTVKYLRSMMEKWPGTTVEIEHTAASSTCRPVIKALHIVWPWSEKIMNMLAESIFCDATFHITLYKYKVRACCHRCHPGSPSPMPCVRMSRVTMCMFMSTCVSSCHH